MNKSLLLIPSIMVYAALLISGCKKEQAPQNTNTTSKNITRTFDSTAITDETTASFVINDSKNICDAAANSQAVDRLSGLCETYRKFDTVINTIHDTAIDVNFGPTDCICLDGRTRRGHIIVYWNSKAYFDSAATIIMTFNNYYLNDILVSGNRSLTNISTRSSGMQSWRFSANLALNYPNGRTGNWTSTRTANLTIANSLYYYAFTGSASGVSQIDSAYNVTITNPLYQTVPSWWMSGGCAWYQCGNLTISSRGFAYPIYVSYGNLGTCDNQAAVAVNGSSYYINLP